MEYATANGNLQILQRLYSSCPASLRYGVVIAAALRGDLPLLQWMKAVKWEVFHQEQLWAEQIAFAEKGELQTVQWLVTEFPETAWSLGPAAAGGSIEMVEWLHLHGNLDVNQLKHRFSELGATGFRYWLPTCEECCGAEQMELQRRLATSWPPKATDAMDFAAERGHLEVLKWLHVNRSEGCSAGAVNGAAASGNMEILQWLHEHLVRKRWTWPRKMGTSRW